MTNRDRVPNPYDTCRTSPDAIFPPEWCATTCSFQDQERSWGRGRWLQFVATFCPMVHTAKIAELMVQIRSAALCEVVW